MPRLKENEDADADGVAEDGVYHEAMNFMRYGDITKTDFQIYLSIFEHV